MSYQDTVEQIAREELTNEQLEFLKKFRQEVSLDPTKLGEVIAGPGREILGELDERIRNAMKPYWTKNLNQTLQAIRGFDGSKALYLRPDVGRPPRIGELLSKTGFYADKIIMIDPLTYEQLLDAGPDIGLARPFASLSLPYLLDLKEWLASGILVFVPQPETWNLEIAKVMKSLIADATQRIRTTVGGVDMKKSSPGHIMKSKQKDPYDITSQKLSTSAVHPLFAGQYLDAFPFTDWNEDYYYWDWLARAQKKSLKQDTKLLTALSRTKINWFGNVPLAYVLGLRQKGMLEETRVTIRENFHDIRDSEESEFDETVKACSEKLSVSIRQHEHEWQDAKRDLSNQIAIGGSIAIVGGAITATAASQLSPMEGLGALAAIGVGVLKSVKSLPDYLKIRGDLRRKPINIFFRAKTEAEGERDMRSRISVGYMHNIPKKRILETRKFGGDEGLPWYYLTVTLQNYPIGVPFQACR